VKRIVELDGQAESLELDAAGNFVYGGERGRAEILAVQPGTYSILIGARSYHVRVAPSGPGAWSVRLCGHELTAGVQDPRAAARRRSGGGAEGQRRIATSMPGKVVRLLVAPGDAVTAGQGLIVVEAMKMQNEIKAPRAGRVLEVRAAEGATVAAGEALLILE
jgi:biotin carboxyl carrier protein